MDEREAMARAIALAWRGWGRVGANPMVGAVLLRGGEVIAEGWHAEFGGPHGEAAAVAKAGPRARGATLVVTLEPCAHHGKTPPCADAIAAAGLSRVVFGAADVDPRAKGGAGVLRRAGIAVASGLLEVEVRAQNATFFHRHSGAARPFVAVKLAVSLDGRIADARGRSRWVSGPEAREWVHWLRAGFDAVAVGAGTVLADDPRITVRGAVQPLRPPLRVIFDRRAETRPEATLVRTARELPTVLVAGSRADGARLARLEAAGVAILRADELDAALASLWHRGAASLLVEGGGVLAGRLLAAGLVDRMFLVTAPILLGGGGPRALAGLPDAHIESVPRWRVVGRRALGDDSLLVLDRP